MNIGILHLSDVHFKDNTSNPVSKRAEKIKAAVQSTLNGVSACFIVFTGDLAFAGKIDEYVIAESFLTELVSELRSISPSLFVRVIAIPGNHDCDFTKDNALRKITLNNCSNLKDALNPNDDSIVRALTSVQDDFFNFLARIEQKLNDATISSKCLEGYGRLCYERTFELNNLGFRFNCYNSAWMSKQHEEQAKLIFPLHTISLSEERCDLVVAAFHHPALWFESVNSREFRNHVEVNADLVLSGHEHIGQHYTKSTLDGNSTEYIEGEALFDEGGNSAFQFLAIDLEGKRKRVSAFMWHDNHYSIEKESDWSPFHRAKQLRRAQFEWNNQFRGYLYDPGMEFSHPSSKRIALDDIFVYPELDTLPFGKRALDAASEIVTTENVLDFALGNPQLLITASDKAGKTSLAKRLFVEMHERGIVPILVDGRLITSPKPEAFIRLVEDQFKNQYDADDLVKYRELPSIEKALIIDDLHLSRLGRKNRNAIMEVAREVFGKVLLFADDVFVIEVMSEEVDENSILFSFRRARLREFGRELRYLLIQKWVSFGDEGDGDEEDMQHRISESDGIVGTLIGNKMLPSYPFVILSMLQMLESNANPYAAPGVYGYFYEFFILQALSVHVTPTIPMNYVIAFTPTAAQRMFALKRRSLSEAELNDVIDKYRKERGVNFPAAAMRAILLNSGTMRQEASGLYKFKHKYIYYYFLAKQFALDLRNEIREGETRALVSEMASKLYVEEFANIILFLVYLTGDERIISQTLEQARALYSEFDPCDLDEHMVFISTTQSKPMVLTLPPSPPDENRRKHLRTIDDTERKLVPGDDREDDDRPEEEQQLDDLLRINVSFKTLDMLGQILRNFPGDLTAELKFELARESYLLSLRTMRMLFKILEDNAPEFRALLAEVIGEKRKLEGRDLEDAANRLFFLLSMAIGFVFVKRVSEAVRSELLERTYSQILKETDSVIAVPLIDLAIKLDHFHNFPEQEVKDLHERTRNNIFAHGILRHLVRNRFVMWRAPYGIKQKVCKLLGIGMGDPKMIGPGDKKE
jgi:hypothetical protein